MSERLIASNSLANRTLEDWSQAVVGAGSIPRTCACQGKSAGVEAVLVNVQTFDCL